MRLDPGPQHTAPQPSGAPPSATGSTGACRRGLAVLLVLLGMGGSACSQDYTVKDIPDNNPGDDTGWPPVSGSASPLAAPDWCPPDDGLPTTVGLDESCAHDTTTGTIAGIVEWELASWSNYGEYSQVVMAPVVGQLDDDNGDGLVDRDDVPDIVVITDDEGLNTHKKGILRVTPGDGLTGGRAVQRVDTELDGMAVQVYPYRYGNAALGDVDNDGEAEIVVIVQLIGGAGGDGGGEGGDEGGEEGGGGEDEGSGEGGAEGGDEGPDPGDEGGDGGEEVPISFDDGGSGEAGADGGGGSELGGPSKCYVAAFTPQLDLDWVATEAELPCGGHAPALADLDADGDPEVVVSTWILNGADGSVQARAGGGAGGVGAYLWHPEIGHLPVPADLDGDGQQEIVTGSTIYTSTGDVRCDFADPELDGFPAVADLDMDGEGEVVSVGNGVARVFDKDCTELATFPLEGTGNGGPPTVADFDADGEPEIGVASGSAYAVYEPDGTVLWSNPVEDESSGVTGSAVYDFEGDGQPEVVYADETRFWIFAGNDGAVRFETDKHASRTLHELPTVADVDGDGMVEVLIPNGGGHQDEDKTGIWVLGSENGDWLPGRQVWNQHAFSLTNINDDLSIPVTPTPNWPLHNNFRSGDPQPVSGGDSPDAVPLAELCTAECDQGRLVVRVRVGNSGAADMRRDVPVSLYAEDVSGVRSFLGSSFSLYEVAPGETTDAIVLRIDWSAWEGQDLVVVADDDDGQQWTPECTEDNNELVFAAPSCR